MEGTYISDESISTRKARIYIRYGEDIRRWHYSQMELHTDGTSARRTCTWRGHTYRGETTQGGDTYTHRGDIYAPPSSFPSCPIERSYYFFCSFKWTGRDPCKKEDKRKKMKKDKNKKKPLQICLIVADGGGGFFYLFIFYLCLLSLIILNVFNKTRWDLKKKKIIIISAYINTIMKIAGFRTWSEWVSVCVCVLGRGEGGESGGGRGGGYLYLNNWGVSFHDC